MRSENLEHPEFCIVCGKPSEYAVGWCGSLKCSELFGAVVERLIVPTNGENGK